MSAILENNKYACLSPKKIITRDGKTLFRPCGYCYACVTHSTNIYTEKVKKEFTNNSECVFLTLTYSEKYIPTFEIQSISESDSHLNDDVTINTSVNDIHTEIKVSNHAFIERRISNISYKNKRYAETIARLENFKSELTIDIPFRDWVQYCTTSKNSNKFTYPFYEDFQQFINTLKLKLYDYCKANKLDYASNKFTYQCVSEYGSTTLRPHFHVIIWSQSPVTKLLIKKSLRKISKKHTEISNYYSSLWQFGISNCKFPKGTEDENKVADYCASYLNSYYCLPMFLQNIKVFKPKKKTSHCLGRNRKDEGIFTNKLLSIYGIASPEKICNQQFTSYTSGNELSLANNPQISNILFPKSPISSNASYWTSATLFSSYLEIKRLTNNSFKCKKQCKDVLYNQLYNNESDNNHIFTSSTYILRNWIGDGYLYLHKKAKERLNEDEFRKYFDYKLATLFAYFKKVNYICENLPIKLSFNQLLDYINSVRNRIGYNMLIKQMYRIEESNFNSLYYDNSNYYYQLFKDREQDFFLLHKERVFTRCQDRIKHKENISEFYILSSLE